MYVLPAAVSSPGGQSWRPWLEVLTSFIAIVVVVGWSVSWCQPTLDAIFLRASGPLPEGLCWGSLAGRESSVALRSLVLAVVCRFLQQGYAYAYCMAGLAEFPRALLLARLSVRESIGIELDPKYTDLHSIFNLLWTRIYWLALNIQCSISFFPCVCGMLSRDRLFATPWTAACFSLGGLNVSPSMGFPRQEYWRGCHFLLQGIFPIQGSIPHLLHWPAWEASFFPAYLQVRFYPEHTPGRLNLSCLIYLFI